MPGIRPGKTIWVRGEHLNTSKYKPANNGIAQVGMMSNPARRLYLGHAGKGRYPLQKWVPACDGMTALGDLGGSARCACRLADRRHAGPYPEAVGRVAPRLPQSQCHGERQRLRLQRSHEGTDPRRHVPVLRRRRRAIRRRSIPAPANRLLPRDLWLGGFYSGRSIPLGVGISKVKVCRTSGFSVGSSVNAQRED
jgi:hypothetical protein